MPYKDRKVAREKQKEYTRRYLNKDRQRTRTFYVWCEMRRRCLDPNHKQYADYGGRGIGVCARWLESFKNFLADMGKKPDGLNLDRIDNNGNYEPSNCRWATRQQNNSNRRNCILVEVNGERMALKEACRRKGMSYRAARNRVRLWGWPAEFALSVPIRGTR